MSAVERPSPCAAIRGGWYNLHLVRHSCWHLESYEFAGVDRFFELATGGSGFALYTIRCLVDRRGTDPQCDQHTL